MHSVKGRREATFCTVLFFRFERPEPERDKRRGQENQQRQIHQHTSQPPGDQQHNEKHQPEREAP